MNEAMNAPAPRWRLALQHFQAWAHLVGDSLEDWRERRALSDDIDFVEDATQEIIEQDARGLRAVSWTALFLVLALLVWAGFSRIDEMAKGEGKVVPASAVQVIQSLDGGIVQELLVRQGSVVDKGQLLLRIDPTRFTSSLRENVAQVDALRLKALRLAAVAEDKAFEPPAELLASDPELVAQELRLFDASKSELQAALTGAQEQVNQRSQDLAQVRAQEIQASTSYGLVQKELKLTQPLVASGAVSDVELLRLEREVARLLGERDGARARIPGLEAAVKEAESKLAEVGFAWRNKTRNELSEVSAKLKALSEGQVGLADRVKQSDVRSPVRGTVKQLFANTVGGVVQPGKDILEIVPLEDSLLLETRVLPKDIAFISPGQAAMVKFTAYDFSVYGGLDAKVEQIGADTVTDEKGNAFYIVTVRTSAAFLGEAKLPIIPGMTAEVDILTGKRSILSYLLKPLLRAKAGALRET
ncbi:MAG: HlyD family type I secretion periplasmic adaptor subunit [Gammaproteobacteria bacterium]|nr:HlyD family type I secretion periplasmic adaptor subunit [Gammaproteobacteria bacterium]